VLQFEWCSRGCTGILSLEEHWGPYVLHSTEMKADPIWEAGRRTGRQRSNNRQFVIDDVVHDAKCARNPDSDLATGQSWTARLVELARLARKQWWRCTVQSVFFRLFLCHFLFSNFNYMIMPSKNDKYQMTALMEKRPSNSNFIRRSHDWWYIVPIHLYICYLSGGRNREWIEVALARLQRNWED